MFHGYFPSRETDAAPYAILRNVHRMPDLFCPILGGWTVSESLKEKLLPFKGTEFREITFTRLVDVPWEVGEAPPIPAGAYEGGVFGGGIVPAKFFAALPRASPARRKVGRYYGFAPPAAYIEESRYRAVKPVPFDFTELAPKDTFVFPASEGHALSVAMMADYPVIQNDRYLFFTEASFRVIDPYVDMRFFVKGELDLRRRSGRCT